jgi:hypothetical protein
MSRDSPGIVRAAYILLGGICEHPSGLPVIGQRSIALWLQLVMDIGAGNTPAEAQADIPALAEENR